MARRTVNIPFSTTEVGIVGIPLQGAANLLLNMPLDMGINTRPGMTIVRIRGTVNLEAAISGAASVFHIALMVVPEGGMAVVPNLATEVVNAIWRLDGQTSGRVDEIAAGVFAPPSDIFQVESQGMRKISRVGDEMRLFVSVPATANVIATIQGTVRMMLE